MRIFLFSIALVAGAIIAYIDSRPGWDDAGVTAAMLLMSGGMLGFFGPNRAWQWALALGLWIPFFGIVGSHNFSSLIALIPPFIGVYGGMAIRRFLSPVGK